MSGILADLAYGARQLRRNPGFTAAAIVCVMLGIGANAATFSFARAFLLRTPQVREPEALVRMYIQWESGLRYGSFSYPDIVDLRERNDVFGDVLAENPLPFHVSADSRNERVLGSIVTGNYFAELGVPMHLGRGFLPEEDAAPGTHPVVVLSHGSWQRRFASDPDILDRQIVVSGQKYSVVGVTAAEFVGMNTGLQPELYVPMMMQGAVMPGRNTLEARGDHWINGVTARLRPGISRAQAEQAVNTVMAQLAEEYPDTNRGITVELFPYSEAALHPRVRGAFVGFMGLMFGVVGLVLLLACANIAGLLLARYASRCKEIAIRLAVGASRGRIIRQLLAESSLLALLSGGAGLLLALWLTRLVSSFRPSGQIPIQFDVALDSSVVAFTFLATLLTGLLFGLAPALQASRQDLVPALKEGADTRGRRSRMRQALVAGQVGLSLVLLVGSGLVVRSLQNVKQLDPGFEPDQLLIGTTDIQLQGYDESRGRQFMQEVRRGLAALPGVTDAGFAIDVPLSLSSRQNGAVPEGFVVEPGSDTPSIDYNSVDHGYFDAMGIARLRGRGFAETDAADAPPVLIVNQTFADRYWPGEEPLGKHVRTRGSDHTVIGVVQNGKYFSLGEDPKPFMYYALDQAYRGAVTLHVRTAGPPEALIPSVRRVVRERDAELPFDVQTMHEAMGFALLPARMAAGVISVFAGLALLLAAVGLYGVMAYWIRQKARSVAIRMAVGAERRDVIGLVVGNGMRLVAIGLAGGLVTAGILATLVSGLLYDVGAADPLAYTGAVTALLVVAFMATLIPALRASRVDPISALRQE